MSSNDCNTDIIPLDRHYASEVKAPEDRYGNKIYKMLVDTERDCSNEVVFLWNRTLVAFVHKLSSTTVDFSL